MPKENPFVRKQDQEIKQHSGPSDKKIVKCTFSIYEEDYDAIVEMIETLSLYTSKRASKSLVVRAAINYLRKTVEKVARGGQGALHARNRVKEVVRESV